MRTDLLGIVAEPVGVLTEPCGLTGPTLVRYRLYANGFQRIKMDHAPGFQVSDRDLLIRVETKQEFTLQMLQGVTQRLDRLESVAALKTDVERQLEETRREFTGVAKAIQDSVADLKGTARSEAERITGVEKRVYMIMGGFAVLNVIIKYLPFHL